MSTPTPTRLPKYRHFKPKDLAIVRLDGQDHYLGTVERRDLTCVELDFRPIRDIRNQP